MLLEIRRDGDGLAGEQGREPLRGPGAFAGIIDASQRLQSDGLARLARERAAEVMPVAAHGKGGRPDRPAKVEGEDLRVRIAPELQRHQRQQHALAGAGRAHDQRMADVADMEGEAERRRALRPGEEQRRTVKMLVPFRPGPDRREGHHVGEVEGRDRRLAHVGVDMPRQAAEPGFDRVQGSRMQVKSRPWMVFSTRASRSSAMRRILVPDRHRRGDIGLRHEIRAQLLQRRSRHRAPCWRRRSPASTDASFVITSFRIAMIDLRLANHWRRMRASTLAASVLSMQIARVDQR